MSEVMIADEKLIERLDRADGPLEICTWDGRRLGFFTPAKPAQYNWEPPGGWDEAFREAERDANDPNAKWYTAEQVEARLREIEACTK